MHWTFLISLLSVGIVAYVTLRDRRSPVKLVWWWVGVPVALVVPLALGLVQFATSRAPASQAEGLRLVQYGLWGAGFVATIAALLLTFGRAGDGRAVAWKAPIAALVGIVLAGLMNPVAAAWLAPLVVLAVCARAMPTASSLRRRRLTLAVLGMSAVVCTNAGLLLTHRIAVLRGRANDLFDEATIQLTDPGIMMEVGDVGPILFVAGIVLGIGLAGTIVAK